MNHKKGAITVVFIVVLWFVMDFLLHGVLLMDIYKETPQLWRSAEEMSVLHNLFWLFIYSFLFTAFYQFMIHPKNPSQGVKFGAWYGLLGGFAMAGSYIWMPISLGLAFGWFLVVWIKMVAAGAVLGYLLKD